MNNSDQCSICSARHIADGSDENLIYKDDFWILRHSRETNILGYLVLESRRHFLDLSEATDSEAASYGRVLSAAMRAVRKVTSCQRVYTFSLGEAVPHFHVHIIPRTASFPRAFRGRGVLSYPLTPPADAGLCAETVKRVRRALKPTLRS